MNSVEGRTEIKRNENSEVTYIGRATNIIDSVEESSFRVLATVSGLKWIEIGARR